MWLVCSAAAGVLPLCCWCHSCLHCLHRCCREERSCFSAGHSFGVWTHTCSCSPGRCDTITGFTSVCLQVFGFLATFLMAVSLWTSYSVACGSPRTGVMLLVLLMMNTKMQMFRSWLDEFRAIASDWWAQIFVLLFKVCFFLLVLQCDPVLRDPVSIRFSAQLHADCCWETLLWSGRSGWSPLTQVSRVSTWLCQMCNITCLCWMNSARCKVGVIVLNSHQPWTFVTVWGCFFSQQILKVFPPKEQCSLLVFNFSTFLLRHMIALKITLCKCPRNGFTWVVEVLIFALKYSKQNLSCSCLTLLATAALAKG